MNTAVVRNSIGGIGEKARASRRRGWAVPVKAAFVGSGDLETVWSEGIAVDFTDVVAHIARSVAVLSVGVLELKDVVREVAVVVANFEGDAVVENAGVLLVVATAVGGKVVDSGLGGVAACWVAAVRLEASLEDEVEVAAIDEVDMAACRGGEDRVRDNGAV